MEIPSSLKANASGGERRDDLADLGKLEDIPETPDGNNWRPSLHLGGDAAALAAPADAVLDDAALERVAGDAEQLGGFDDAARGGEGGLAEEALGDGEVVVVEDDVHAVCVKQELDPSETTRAPTEQAAACVGGRERGQYAPLPPRCAWARGRGRPGTDGEGHGWASSHLRVKSVVSR